jgi:hypothetical protein
MSTTLEQMSLAELNQLYEFCRIKIQMQGDNKALFIKEYIEAEINYRIDTIYREIKTEQTAEI